MKKHTQRRKICDSWYHQRWFRILLVIVAVDMIMLGGTVMFGLDFLSLLDKIPIFINIIGGLAYILVAVFIIHQALSYSSLHKNTHFVCQHCAHIE
ncbi:MAG: hypothetical protein ACI870_000276 [Crocinitomicaceae bacterium]|jgi:hypothetical protein